MSSGIDVSPTTDQAWLLATLESQQRLIHKVCWAYTRTPEDREDLFQEIAVRLLGGREITTPAASCRPGSTASRSTWRLIFTVGERRIVSWRSASMPTANRVSPRPRNG